MNCECNNNSNRVEPRIKHVYGNVLRMAIPLTLRTLVKDGDEMIVNDTDFIPSSDHLVRVVFSKGKTNYPVIATMDGNVAIVEDKGKIPVGTYDISVECYDDLGNPYRFKQNAVLYVADTTAEAGIDEEIEYEAQTWYLNAAVFLATTEIGEIGDVIDAKLDDVFGNVLYDANAKEIRFYNKDNSRLLATIDSRPFIVDGTVADVYIDVSRQVLVVVLNEDAGGRRFSVPLYLVFNSYYKKDEVDSLVSRTVEGVRFDFSQELPLVVPVTKNGSSISSPIDYGAIENAIREDGRLVVACVNNDKYYQLLAYIGMEVAFSRVVALDGYQELLIVNESNVWSMEDVDLGTGGGGYEPPAGGIPKSDLAQSVQDTLDDVDNKVDKETGKGLSTNDYTTAEKTKLAGIAAGAEVNVQPNWTQTNTSADDYIKNKPTIPSKTSELTNDAGYTNNTGTITGITMNGASKGTSGVVDLGTVITAHQDISGKANASDVYTKTQADTLLAGKLSKSDVSVETQGDGTVDINVGSGANKDTYTINLNHTHENMAKLVVCEESELPSTLEEDTIYGVEEDGEISVLYVGGIPFYGGGGGGTSTPVLRQPTDGSTIDVGRIASGESSVTKTITVKGKNLTQALTVAVTGTGYSVNKQSIPAADANVGTTLTITCTNTNGISAGTLSIASSEVSCDCDLVVFEDLRGVKLTGSQWLQTDYKPNSNTEFVLTCRFEQRSDTQSTSKDNYEGNIFSCINGSSNKWFYLRNNAATGVNAYNPWNISFVNEDGVNYGDGYQIIVLSGESTRPYIFVDPVQIYYTKGSSNGTIGFTDGTHTLTKPTSLKSSTQENAMMIGRTYNPNNSKDMLYSMFNLTIYSFVITENGDKVRHWVAKSKNGVPGLYDTVNDTFISSETSTELVAVN